MSIIVYLQCVTNFYFFAAMTFLCLLMEIGVDCPECRDFLNMIEVNGDIS